MFFPKFLQILNQIKDGFEIKQLGQQLLYIFLARLCQLSLSWLPTFYLVGELNHRGVVLDTVRGDGRAEYQSFQRFATAQGHIYLSMGKRSTGINDRFLKCKPLAFVNGNGPSQFEGKLGKSSDHLFGDFLGLFIERIFCILPFHFHHINCLPVVRALNLNFIVTDIDYFANFAIVKTFFR